MRIATASEMAQLDRRTIEEVGIPGIVLMENAARGAAGFFLEVVPDLLRKRTTVVAGSGNNAGDGFVLARIFQNSGGRVRVVCLRPPDGLQGDALTNYRILENMGTPIHIWDEEADFSSQWRWIEESDVIIDALLGTGLRNEVRGTYRKVIEGINDLGVPVLAVDIPSGLHAGTGKPMGAAIRARATATFGLIKLGHLLEPGTAYVGRLSVVDIGIPVHIFESADIRRWWLDHELLSTWISPRPPAAHKGNAGHAVVLAGSPGKTGAAALACLGAGRAGAGLVTLLIPSSLNPILEVKLTEAMTVPIPETEDHSPSDTGLPLILDFLRDKQALAMGPGISLHSSTRTLVKNLLVRSPCPTVLDADAITAMAPEPERFKDAPHPVVLTPHPGEMSRLTGKSTREIQENRVETAGEFAVKYGVTLVLKGHRSLIASPDGRLAVNSTGNPGMACGGMGDVLTGMIAGFLAQGFPAFEASCLGVYIHGAAADRRMGEISSRGLLASDLLEEIPGVIGRLEGFEAPSCKS